MISQTAEPLALSIVLIGWAALLRALAGTWLHPSALFAMWWCFAGILPLILAPYDPVSAGVMLWVIASSVAVGIGATLGNGGFRTRVSSARPSASAMEHQVFGSALIVSSILGLASSVSYAIAFGVSPGDLLDIERLVVVSNQLYVARYAEPNSILVAPPLLSQALLPFVYLAPALGGAVFVAHRNLRWRTLAISTLVPAIVVTVLQTTKAAVLFAATLWLSSYFASRLRLGRLAVFTRAHLLLAGILGAVVTAFFFAVGLARLASTDVGLLDIVRAKLISAAFGHMAVFSQWLSQYWNQPFAPTLGVYTFAGPREMLGIQQRVPGIFDNVVELLVGETSNIFTGFRPLIEDFTMPGALLVLALLGLLAGIAFRLVAGGHWGAVPVLVGAYMTILWTPITWFWIYNSLTATVVGLALLTWVLRTWRRARPSALMLKPLNAAGVTLPALRETARSPGLASAIGDESTPRQE